MDFQSIALPTELRYLLPLSDCKFIFFFDIPQEYWQDFLILFFPL